MQQPQQPSTAKPGGDAEILEVTLEEKMVPVHVTGDVGLLSDVRAPATPAEQSPESIFGIVHRAAALGTLATPHFDVPDVRHVPGVCIGQRAAVVVSLSELARRGFKVEWFPWTYLVKDPTTGQILGRARLRDGRYYLDYLRVPHAAVTPSP